MNKLPFTQVRDVINFLEHQFIDPAIPYKDGQYEEAVRELENKQLLINDIETANKFTLRKTKVVTIGSSEPYPLSYNVTESDVVIMQFNGNLSPVQQDEISDYYCEKGFHTVIFDTHHNFGRMHFNRAHGFTGSDTYQTVYMFYYKKHFPPTFNPPGYSVVYPGVSDVDSIVKAIKKGITVIHAESDKTAIEMTLNHLAYIGLNVPDGVQWEHMLAVSAPCPAGQKDYKEILKQLNGLGYEYVAINLNLPANVVTNRYAGCIYYFFKQEKETSTMPVPDTSITPSTPVPPSVWKTSANLDLTPVIEHINKCLTDQTYLDLHKCIVIDTVGKKAVFTIRIDQFKIPLHLQAYLGRSFVNVGWPSAYVDKCAWPNEPDALCIVLTAHI